MRRAAHPGLDRPGRAGALAAAVLAVLVLIPAVLAARDAVAHVEDPAHLVPKKLEEMGLRQKTEDVRKGSREPVKPLVGGR